MRFRNLLIPLVLGVLATAPAVAQDCVDYAAGVHVAASLPPEARYLAAHGDHLYLSSLHVVDVATPGSPVDLGAFAGPDGVVKDLAVADGYLFAAFTPGAFGTFGGLAVFDLAAPGAPVLAGTVPLPGLATALAAGSGRAYVRTDDGYVHIIDVSDPAAPQVLGSLGAGAVTAFDATGDIVYAWDRIAAMMRVYNAANAAAPVVWTTWPLAGVEDVELALGRLLVFAGGSYRAYGLADPLAPTFAQVLPAVDRVCDFHGNQAAAYGFPAKFWDLSAPASPVLLATVPYVVHSGFMRDGRVLVGVSDDFCELVPGDGSARGATGSLALDQAPTGLAVLGSHALVLKEMGLDVVDASDCTAPTPVASLLVPGLNDGYAVAGDWLYILARSGIGSALQVVDLRNPAAPVDAAFVPASSARLQGLVAAGSRLYTARGSVLVPIDISDPANPVVEAGLPGLGFGAVAAAAGNLLVTANDWEVRTFSLADPAAPAPAGVLQTDLYGRGLLLDGATACLLHDEGVALFDVSDPANIAPLGALDVPGTLDGFALAGHRLYVEGNGIHVIDISDPAAPAFVGSLPYGSDTFAPLAAVGQCLWFAQYVSPDMGRINIAPLACAAGGGGGGGGEGDDPEVVTIDIRPGSDTNPVRCGGRVHGVVPVAILSENGFDALTIDHASVRFGPGQAQEAHTRRVHEDRGRGHGHGDRNGHGRGDQQLVPRRHEVDVDCDGDLDLLLHFRLDDADIACGAKEASLTALTFAGVEVAGSDRVTTVPGCADDDDKGRGGRGGRDGRDGHHDDDDDEDEGFDCAKDRQAAGGKGGASAPLLAPNPFNPQTRVLFSLEQPGRVTVSVYDLAGRRLAVVADGEFAAGPQDVLWDGRDDAGMAVSSGVYFVRVEGAGPAVNLRAVLLR